MRRSRVNRSPESGYKFECQGCEEEVFQGPPPELVFALDNMGTKRNPEIHSTPLQCCVDCAIEIREDNEKLVGKQTSQRQVRDLRPSGELEAVIPAELKEQVENTANAKLDKVLDALGQLMKLMVLQMEQKTMPPVVIPPAATTPLKPKRAILAPPKAKTNASKTAKPKAAKAAKAKPKSRRS